MEIIHQCCCGLDVHKGSVTPCVLWAGEKGKKRREERSYALLLWPAMRWIQFGEECRRRDTPIYLKPSRHTLRILGVQTAGPP